MASGGDGPRLPETDDPFVLLGIDSGADKKTIRQAYARLIKIYRPDRSPAEFQRIHAAFEELKQQDVQDRELPLAFEARASDPCPPTPEAAPAERDQKDDRLAREAELSAKVSTQLAEAERAAKAGDAAALSWSALSKLSLAIEERGALWMTAWDGTLETDPAVAERLLDDDVLRLDAADDPRVATMVLCRIGALCWRRNYGAMPLLEMYRKALPRDTSIDGLLDSVDLEIVASREVRRIRSGLAIVEALTSLLISARIGPHTRCREHATKLFDLLGSNVETSLAELDEVATAYDLGPLFELLYDYLPVNVTRLDALAKPVLAQLSGELHVVGHQPNKWKFVGGGAAAAGATVFAVGFLPVAGALALAAGYGLATEKRRYAREIRPRLARAILAVPVTTSVVSRWVRFNSRLAGRLSRFDMAIDEDAALYAFSMMASLAASFGTD